MSETWNNDGYSPDFIERNGAWLLSVFGIVSACVSGMFVYFLKSRCTRIACCGSECVRSPINLDVVDEAALELNAMPKGRAPSSSDAV